MPRFLFALLCLVACREAGTRAPADQLPPSLSGASSAAGTGGVPATPGVCGPWETADSTSRQECRRRLGDPRSDLGGPVSGADCAYQETMAPDSLRACLARADSSARQCPVVRSWRVHQADGVTRPVEWRRCGPQGGATVDDSIVWPVHFLQIWRDTATQGPPIFSYSNLPEPGISGLDTVMVLDLDGEGSEELLIVNSVYGTGSIFEVCALAVAAGAFHCWTGPDFPPGSRGLRDGESLKKGWVFGFGGPEVGPVPPAAFPGTGRSLWYETPVYRDGDGNCCPSANASLWVEARPRNGRFETGLWLRATEDSARAILRLDTLPH